MSLKSGPNLNYPETFSPEGFYNEALALTKQEHALELALNVKGRLRDLKFEQLEELVNAENAGKVLEIIGDTAILRDYVFPDLSKVYEVLRFGDKEKGEKRLLGFLQAKMKELEDKEGLANTDLGEVVRSFDAMDLATDPLGAMRVVVYFFAAKKAAEKFTV